MDKNSLGNKRICVGCSSKFYDLGKNPAPCPKCKTMNDINAQFKVRRKSKAVIEVDNDDPLVKQKAKQEAKQKPKKAGKHVEGVDLEDFEEIVVEGEDEIEEMEEIDDIDDIEDLEELEDVETEGELDDDELAIDDDTLIDDVEEDGELEEAEEEEAPAPKKPAKSSAKPASKGKKK